MSPKLSAYALKVQRNDKPFGSLCLHCHASKNEGGISVKKK